MNKKEIKKQKHISLEKFLRCYVGIENEFTLDWLSSLTHRELKEVCEELRTLDLTRISFEDVTREDVQIGDVLLVLDNDNNPAPYINPKQMVFDDIMEEEAIRKIEKLINPENHVVTYDEYTDTLDDIALDKGITNNEIKKLSYRRKTYRKGEEK